ncbi:hypothetical protein [Granulosicoccus antarcticus]|uniref:Uncharacterized protein n=1 Tax=Granulosicoccus antarcticus IMCC3135 TaxID=1192854 RepID=A0A2Z2NIA9_9GAMM|nr:hypothetical protein [Granulosicoccus antarcticus]ASJ70793.1 hypothetical protein IMCC3135_03400 [Granulosicoccus antarcticus IMCC3135]
MTRRVTAVTGLALLFALIVADFIGSPPNPYQQPAIVALGSGAASSGGFCGALPE